MTLVSPLGGGGGGGMTGNVNISSLTSHLNHYLTSLSPGNRWEANSITFTPRSLSIYESYTPRIRINVANFGKKILYT